MKNKKKYISSLSNFHLGLHSPQTFGNQTSKLRLLVSQCSLHNWQLGIQEENYWSLYWVNSQWEMLFESINKSVLSWNPDKKLFSIGVDNAYNYVLVRMIKDWLSEKAIVAFRWKVVPHPIIVFLILLFWLVWK